MVYCDYFDLIVYFLVLENSVCIVASLSRGMMDTGSSKPDDIIQCL